MLMVCRCIEDTCTLVQSLPLIDEKIITINDHIRFYVVFAEVESSFLILKEVKEPIM